MMSYNNVTEDVWDCLKKEVAQYGVTIMTDSGTETTHGFIVLGVTTGKINISISNALEVHSLCHALR